MGAYKSKGKMIHDMSVVLFISRDEMKWRDEKNADIKSNDDDITIIKKIICTTIIIERYYMYAKKWCTTKYC